ncbi:hypothetical protein HHL11_10280 [Ramlibacter sp. G-1-2-2]|uniref:PsbP C-terminal domain-containing protein n=1 Tax=Ramlibacter agri TaxID=2728837 RepID=A0A848H0Z4_9BURK|nr:hypothetical protein [Ramlibacter agri]NML44137.1 hypothetical protein [Ramlibacter agri]
MPCRFPCAALLLASACIAAAAQDVKLFDSRGLRGSEGVSVRLPLPASWHKVEPEDDLALAEFRGPQGQATGILQIARRRLRAGADAACAPARAPELLRQLPEEEADTRITDVFARQVAGRPGYEVHYERDAAPAFLAVRSVIVCLKDSRLLVSCGGTAAAKPALADLEPACQHVLENVEISED